MKRHKLVICIVTAVLLLLSVTVCRYTNQTGMFPAIIVAAQSNTSANTQNGTTEPTIHRHEWVSTVVAPDCTENGYTRHACTGCGEYYDSDETNPTGHTYGVTVFEPTCTDKGVKTFVCEHCGDNWSEEIAQLEHSFVDTVHERTCTENGYVESVCTDCGELKIVETLEALGHNYVATITSPTCTEEGYSTYVCKTCSDTYIDDRTDATHNYVEEIISEPSCEECGIIAVVCSVCSQILDEHSIPVTDCTYGDWKITKYATPLESGEKSRTCTGCGHSETKSYEASLPSDNYVYVPGRGLCHSFVFADLTQEAVDTYDIIYAQPWGWSNPVITGHANPSTMQHIYDIRIGDYVYVCANGKLEVYEVLVSEEGFTDNACDIYGCVTGTYIWDSLGGKTLRMMTCYKDGWNGGRWMVMAKLVG